MGKERLADRFSLLLGYWAGRKGKGMKKVKKERLVKEMEGKGEEMKH